MGEGKVTRAEFGQAVETVRRMLDWTQQAMAERAGVSNQVVSRIEIAKGAASYASRCAVRGALMMTLVNSLNGKLRVKDCKGWLGSKKVDADALVGKVCEAQTVLGIGMKRYAARAKVQGSTMGAGSWNRFATKGDLSDLSPQDVSAINIIAASALDRLTRSLAVIKASPKTWQKE